MRSPYRDHSRDRQKMVLGALRRDEPTSAAATATTGFSAKKTLAIAHLAANECVGVGTLRRPCYLGLSADGFRVLGHVYAGEFDIQEALGAIRPRGTKSARQRLRGMVSTFPRHDPKG